MLLGLDRANVNGPTDWQAVKADKRGFRFCFYKASQGAHFVDPLYLSERRKARAAGLAVGAYHWGEPDGNPVAQARHFLRCAAIRPGDLAPALDLEREHGAGSATIRAFAIFWLQAVYSELGVRPFLYTMPAFALRHHFGLAPTLARYPLWLAHWGVTRPDVPAPWKQATVWQYTSSGRIPGVPGRERTPQQQGVVSTD